MAWIERKPGRFERPLDSMERFHKAYGAIGHSFDREHFSLTAAVQFQIEAPSNEIAGRLKRAWKTMRYHHPAIAATVEGDTYVYEVPDTKALGSWLEKTFIVEADTATTSSLQANFKPQVLASLHYLPRTSEILFHSAHWRIDGIGTLQFLDSFFQALASPIDVEFGDELSNLTISLDEIAQVSKEITPRTEQESVALLMGFLANLPSIGLATTTGQLPGATCRLEKELDARATSKIIASCRDLDLSVTAAIHAAVVSATQQMADAARSGTKYTTFTFFDLRKRLPAQYQNNKHAVSVNHIGLPASFQPSTFLANAQELKKIYARKILTDEDDMRTILPCYVDKVTAMVSSPPPAGTLPATEGNLSSLGLIDKYLQPQYGDKLAITDFWLGVEMLTAIPIVHAWTRQGRMKFNLSYNESYHTLEVAQKFLDTVINILVESLTA